MNQKRELQYFYVGSSFGGNQDWFRSWMMRVGGCGAETACDACVCLAKYHEMPSLYPGNIETISKEEYIAQSEIMKPYLHPRLHGIDRLEIYIDGFEKYLRDHGASDIHLEGLPAKAPVESAKNAVMKQIDAELPVPMLVLLHRDKAFNDYEWHWFNLTGYEMNDDSFRVKATTYSHSQWLDFDRLWDTGHEKAGGLILIKK